MKEQLHKHNSEVNIDEIWAAIEPQVDAINAEKKRKRFFPFFFIGALILAGSIGLFTLSKTEGVVQAEISQRKITENQSVVTTEVQKTTTPTENITTEVIDKVAETTRLQKNTIETPPTPNSKTVKSINSSSSRKKISPNESVFDSKNSLIEKESPSLIDNTANKQQLIKNQTQTPLQADKKFDLFVPNVLSTKPLVLLEEEKIKPNLPRLIPLESNFSNRKPAFTLDLSLNYGVGFINRELAEKKDISANELLQLRRESETLLEQQHYSLAAKLTHKSGFSFSSGIQHTLLTERYDNFNQITEVDTMFGVKERIVGLDGDTTDVFGFIDVTRTFDYKKQIYNRYRMWDIPLLVGYEGGRDGWTIGVQTGVIFNLSLQTTGEVRNGLNSNLNIGTNQSDIFKSSVGLSIYGGLRVAHTFYNGMTVHLAPHIRAFSEDFAIGEYPLQQKYTTFGVQVGVGYLIGN